MQAQQFSAEPQSVSQRNKYRDGEGPPQNIMHDRRVVRGNTYAALVVPEDDPAELAKHREAQRRRLKRANKTQHRPGTPEPLQGRHHMDVQTDTYLEELTERTIEFEAETQTDFLLDRPPTPLFMPAKIGVDCATQIEDGDLFDFDREVEPILEVLVGKTLERSMMEVLEEEELEAMRRHQEYFQQLRDQELIEVQRMEAAEQRKQDEITRRKEQLAARKLFDDNITRKILSRTVSRSYLSGLANRCFDELYDAGIFHDANLVAVDGVFMPWLLDTVNKKVQAQKRNDAILQAVMSDVVGERNNNHHKVLAKASDQLDEIEAAERRVQQEFYEEKKIAKMEAERVKAEQERMLNGENLDWIEKFGVVAYDAETGLLTLEDESADTVVPEDLKAGVAAEMEARGEEGAKAGRKLIAQVNKSQKLLVAFEDEELPPAEEPAVDEEAG